jgi:hypothetical protein
MLEVDCETTVADLEGSARRLIDWCGLDWEPQCLLFHTRRDPVRTASAVQVRQPVYQHAVGRWKCYDDVLAPIFSLMQPGQSAGPEVHPDQGEHVMITFLSGLLPQSGVAFTSRIAGSRPDRNELN